MTRVDWCLVVEQILDRGCITQETLAEMIGVADTSIKRWKHKGATPPASVQRLLAYLWDHDCFGAYRHWWLKVGQLATIGMEQNQEERV